MIIQDNFIAMLLTLKVFDITLLFRKCEYRDHTRCVEVHGGMILKFTVWGGMR
jgi:hypothetical protein